MATSASTSRRLISRGLVNSLKRSSVSRSSQDSNCVYTPSHAGSSAKPRPIIQSRSFLHTSLYSSSRPLAASCLPSAPRSASCSISSSTKSYANSPRDRSPFNNSEDDISELEPVTHSSIEMAKQSGDWAVDYLRSQFPPLDFPPDVAQRILTHASFREGAQTYGHNTRLAFMGRRALQMYFMLFLQSVSPASLEGRLPQTLGIAATDGADKQPTFEQDGILDFEKLTDEVLDTHNLGKYVGNEWKLERAMRWTSAASRDHSGRPAADPDAGVRKVRGTTVEAVIGGIFHQFGGVSAHVVFHTRVLPNLIPILPASLHEGVNSACERLGGRDAVLRRGSTSTIASGVVMSQRDERGSVSRRVATA